MKNLKKLFIISNFFVLSCGTLFGAMNNPQGDNSQEEDIKQKEGDSKKIDPKELKKFVKKKQNEKSFMLLKGAGVSNEDIFKLLKNDEQTRARSNTR